MPIPALIAITRDVSPSLAACELSFVERAPIDLDRAIEQHRAYRAALATLGCEVHDLPAQPQCPDAVFVEDVAVVVDEVAVMTRPGAESRRGEGATVAPLLARWRTLRAIEAPGTLDGGDVLRIGKRVYVGQSARSNADGIAQLRALLAPHGYLVQGVPIRGCLHLKSAVTALADDAVLLQPAWVDREAFAGFRLVEVDAAEEHAANVLRIGERVVSPACFPRTHARIRAAGIEVVAVDVSELQKAEGAVTCCSLVFETGP
ncbi:dimethylarginine dimethylaminohydrolase family protein [Dokdonella fugitiva]|jgi:dimethylargininase|uniref:Dimethylargininase n=1 Tax=Dokdonella fugitiva TaxID=328517 RepID=A0A4V2S233_9GAMM|nr:arginine deiminase-related protein [Dokdonella fugitiva]MBA8884223.1 dimethylargininase [Dokdonella fugitiva]TCO38910.1 dimethylargininase [Dokdonella fugitiva]